VGVGCDAVDRVGLAPARRENRFVHPRLDAALLARCVVLDGASLAGGHGSNPSDFKDPNFPVQNVSLQDAHEIAEKMTRCKDGFIYRLPN